MGGRQVAPTRRRLAPVPALDGLRGVAVLVVIAYHADALWPAWTGGRISGARPGGGFVGVDLFFVLSGFLITALLLGHRSEGGSRGTLDFYRRRGLRLLPGLAGMLAAYAVYTYLVDGSATGAVLRGLSFTSNMSWKWSELAVPFPLGHLWSVALEAQVYLVWPWLLLACGPKASVRRVLVVHLGLIALVVLNRYRLWDDGYPRIFTYMRPDARVDAVVLGALAGQLWFRGLVPVRALRWALPALVVAFAWLVTNADYQATSMSTIGYTIVAVMFASMVLAAVEGAAGWWNVILSIRPLRWAGRTSYGLYLWHLPVFYVVRTEWAVDGFWPFALAISVTAIAALVSWFALEQPAMRFKHAPRHDEVSDDGAAPTARRRARHRVATHPPEPARRRNRPVRPLEPVVPVRPTDNPPSPTRERDPI